MAAYNQEDIIRYVEGDMPPEERLQFEAILREDAALAESVQQYREITAVLSARLQPDPGLQQLKATLETQRSHFHQKAKVVAFKKYFATIGVAAAVMAGIFLFRFYSRDTNYMANYGNIEMQVAAERGNNEDTLLQSAALYFNEKAYTKVIPLLDTYLSKDSSSQTALYYRGIAATQTGAVEAGMTDLVKVYQGESVFKYDAVFYMALYHAQAGNKKEALIWLKKIPADASAAAKAASLEKDLK